MSTDPSESPNVSPNLFSLMLNVIETVDIPDYEKASVKKRIIELKSAYESGLHRPHGEIDDGGEIPENLDEIVEQILRRSREAEERKSKSDKHTPEK